MSEWDHGYVTDVVYTSNFYRETTPNWIANAALLLGHRPPDLSKPFRYVDFGCAHGFTAIATAATCPHAEVWGFDFNPAHIESARNLAAAAGLTNCHFEEASFGDLLARADSALPEFDIAVSHGVLSWISPENQKALMRLIGNKLRPGGLAYISYNVTTGWAGMVPLRRLMHLISDASNERTDLAVPAMLDFIDKLKGAGANFFGAHPALENRMRDMRNHDARYIAHEYLNRDWHPMMFADVADGMTDNKCSYIGSATLSENIDAVSVPQGMVQLLAETRDQRLRETLRDFGASQGFRRDIFRRGTGGMPAAEHQAMLMDMTVAWTGMVPGDQVTISTPMGQLTGRPELYRPILSALEAGPVKMRDAFGREPFAGRSLLELLQVVTLLTAGGYCHPLLPGGGGAEARDASARLNAATARINSLGGDMPRMVLPAIGSALNVDILETLAVAEILAGRSQDIDSMAAAVHAGLASGGRAVQRDGQPVQDPTEARQIIRGALDNFNTRRVPLLRSLGALS